MLKHILLFFTSNMLVKMVYDASQQYTFIIFDTEFSCTATMDTRTCLIGYDVRTLPLLLCVKPGGTYINH